MPVPKLNILNETIRNLYFHVTMWFSMIFLMLMSLIQSIRYLSSFDKLRDLKANHVFWNLKGRGTNVWYIPEFEYRDETLDAHDFTEDMLWVGT